MSDYKFTKVELREIQDDFEDIKNRLLLLTKGEVIYVTDMIVTEHKKMVNKGLFGLGGKVEKIEYTIDKIYFQTWRTKKDTVSVWSNYYMCSSLGMHFLKLAKERYRLMKDSMTKLGYNVVRLPKKKTDGK